MCAASDRRPARLGSYAAPGSAFVEAALDLFETLRSDTSGLQKKPATAEFIGWLLAMRELAPEADNPIDENAELVPTTTSILIKNRPDQKRARDVVEDWLRERAR